MTRFEQLSVLVIENQLCDAPGAQDLLRNLGIIDVVAARNYQEALTVCQVRVFDVFMCPLGCELNGELRMLEALRRESPWTRAVVTCTMLPSADLAQLRRLGVDDVLERPLSAEKVCEALAKSLCSTLGLWGSIHELDLSALLHMYHHGRRSVVISVDGPISGAIRLRDGEIVDARCGDRIGLSALGQLLSATAGRLATRPDTARSADSIDQSFEHSLLEAAHLLDRERESRRLIAPNAAGSPDDRASSARIPQSTDHSNREESYFMADQAKLTATLVRLQHEVTGFIGASVVDLETGMTLAAHSTRSDFDLTVASAYNSEMVKQKLKTIAALRLKTDFKDMLLTLGDQLHLIQMITPGSFIYLAADKSVTNLAILRTAVAGVLHELR